MFFFFRFILIIVQAATTSTKISDAYQNNELRPFSTGASVPYVTARFSYNNLPNTFVVGDGGRTSNKKYINQPLKANTEYILFVRFFETEVLFVFFISTILRPFWLVVAQWSIRGQLHTQIKRTAWLLRPVTRLEHRWTIVASVNKVELAIIDNVELDYKPSILCLFRNCTTRLCGAKPLRLTQDHQVSYQLMKNLI